MTSRRLLVCLGALGLIIIGACAGDNPGTGGGMGGSVGSGGGRREPNRWYDRYRVASPVRVASPGSAAPAEAAEVTPVE